MADTADSVRPAQSNARTVQEYIDELPAWPDGTALKSAPMTGMQWLIWSLAAAGKFFEGYVVFMTGVALPLIVRDFHIAAAEKGTVGAASLAGILFGAILLGGLSDYFGRKRMFIAEMIIFCAFLALLILCENFLSLAICLFGLGLALGCDYPTAHMIISESIPSANRGKLVIAAFGFQALGALGGTGIGYLVLKMSPTLSAWRWMYATALLPALAVTMGRFFIVESANWLAVRGARDEAEKAVSKLLVRRPQYPKSIAIAATIGGGADHIRSLSDLISDAILAAKGSAMINVLLIVGIVFAVVLADRLGRIKLQIFGFIGCALGLLIASFSIDFSGSSQIGLIFAGFMLFSFMTNIGPNAQTYLLAGEVFPTEVRGMGAGFAAAFAKIGAVMTAFLFPILLAAIGTRLLLYGLIITSLLGAVVTWLYRIETTGVNLERIGR